MSNSEEYLDDLLKSLSDEKEGEDSKSEDSTLENEMTEEKQAFGFLDKTQLSQSSLPEEDEFLKEFEKEMNADNLTDFLKEFEAELNEEQKTIKNVTPEQSVLEEKEEKAMSIQKDETESFDFKSNSLDDNENASADMGMDLQDFDIQKESAIDSDLENVEDKELVNAAKGDELLENSELGEDLEISDVTESVSQEESVLIEDELKSESGEESSYLNSDLGIEESESLDDSLQNLIGEDLFTSMNSSEDSAETVSQEVATDSPKTKEPISDEDELLALLNDLGADGDLADIGMMLQADAMNEPLNDNGINMEAGQDLSQYADALEALDVAGTDSVAVPDKKASKVKKKTEDQIEENSDEEKPSLLKKITSILFGPEEVVDEEAEKAQLEAELTEKERIAQEKAEAKEAKKKEQSEKKAEKQKADKEKKDLKDAQAKEKKEKKLAELALEPKDNTPKIPKKLIALVAIMAISIFALQSLTVKLVGYKVMINQATDLYQAKDYLGAYSKLNGATIETKDEALFHKTQLLANIEQEYNAYQILMAKKQYELALDSLIKGVGRYTIGSEAAKTYGITNEYDQFENQIVQELTSKFNVSAEQAENIYNSETRGKYTLQVKDIIAKAGLN